MYSRYTYRWPTLFRKSFIEKAHFQGRPTQCYTAYPGIPQVGTLHTLTYPSLASDIPLHTLVELLESEEVSVTWHTLEYPIGVKYGFIHLYIFFLNSVIQMDMEPLCRLGASRQTWSLYLGRLGPSRQTWSLQVDMDPLG